MMLTGLSIEQDARDLVRQADERSRGNTSVSSLTIRTIRPGWSLEMTLKLWTRAHRCPHPHPVPRPRQGHRFPAQKPGSLELDPLHRTQHQTPAIHDEPVMDGHRFHQRRPGKRASIVEDYTHTLLGQDMIDGRPCHKISMVPKPDAAVVWGKILPRIDRQDLLILHTEYYDEDGTRHRQQFCRSWRMGQPNPFCSRGPRCRAPAGILGSDHLRRTHPRLSAHRNGSCRRTCTQRHRRPADGREMDA